MTEINKFLVEDLIRLRTELMPRGFNAQGAVKNFEIAEVVWKINSCLYKGYPRRKNNE